MSLYNYFEDFFSSKHVCVISDAHRGAALWKLMMCFTWAGNKTGSRSCVHGVVSNVIFLWFLLSWSHDPPCATGTGKPTEDTFFC